MKVKIVADLTFGDAGKGMVVDNLVHESQPSLVVRYTGGPQAAHTVIRDGKKHIFSNFGSGTLAGAPSFFSRHTAMYLPNLLREWQTLAQLGVDPRLYIDPLTRVITPNDLAYNQAREVNVRHGSCGMGVGAAMKRHEETPYKVHAIDLTNFETLRFKLDAIDRYYNDRIDRERHIHVTDKDIYRPHTGVDYDVYEKSRDAAMFDFLKSYDVCRSAGFPFKIVPFAQLVFAMRLDTLIFEGAQGILLDMDHGFFPNVTYGRTTTRNAFELISEMRGPVDKPVQIYYVTRCYQTRHGAGPMTSDEEITLVNTGEEINVHNEWQQSFRTGELDYDLLKLGWEIDGAYHHEYTHNHIVFTCLDQRPEFEIDFSKIPDTFQVFQNDSPHAGNMRRVLRRDPLILSSHV